MPNVNKLHRSSPWRVKRRKRIIVPLLPEARKLLEECREAERERTAKLTAAGRPAVSSLFVMTTHHGKPWSKDGPTGAWIRACAKAEPKIEKHLHDLRGNFATRLMANGLSDDQIADMPGWQTENFF